VTKLVAKELSREAFAPYGEVVAVTNENEILDINYGRTQRHHRLASVQLGGDDAIAIASIFRSQAVELPFRVEVMERHPLGSQMFMPLSGHPYLVAVAPAGEFDWTAVELFLAQADQGVNYHAGTWHHYCLALEGVSDFLVVDRDGAGDNCDEVHLSDSQQLILGEL
jgi:ureidoglycolate lyase